MKKIGNYLSLFIISFTLFLNSVWAAGYDVTVTSNSVTIGNSVTLKVKVTDAAGKFIVKSSDTSVISVSGGTVWIDNTTQSFTLTTKKVGTATITVVADDVTSYSGSTISGSKKVNVTVKAKPTTSGSSSGNSGSSSSSKPTKPKSSNSFLSSLSIDGIELEEKFDKETLEYTATIPAETEKIKINAQLADSNAKVNGVGEVTVSPGLNTFEIVVTAENGSKRTYVLKATVLELEPIKVEVNKEKYTVVRKRKDLPKISEYFKEKEIEIDGQKIEGYYNEELDYTVVGLKSESGNIQYYIYKNKKYTPYKEYTFNGTTLQILNKELEGSYKKVNFIYDNDKIDSYQEVKMDILKNTYALDNNDITGNQFYLFYAKNVETGKENLYQYDAVEKTVQRYNLEVLNMYKENSNTYYMYLMISLMVIGILIVLFSTITIVQARKNKINKNKKTKKKEHKPKVDIENEDLE